MWVLAGQVKQVAAAPPQVKQALQPRLPPALHVPGVAQAKITHTHYIYIYILSVL